MCLCRRLRQSQKSLFQSFHSKVQTLRDRFLYFRENNFFSHSVGEFQQIVEPAILCSVSVLTTDWDCPKKKQAKVYAWFYWKYRDATRRNTKQKQTEWKRRMKSFHSFYKDICSVSRKLAVAAYKSNELHPAHGKQQQWSNESRKKKMNDEQKNEASRRRSWDDWKYNNIEREYCDKYKFKRFKNRQNINWKAKTEQSHACICIYITTLYNIEQRDTKAITTV